MVSNKLEFEPWSQTYLFLGPSSLGLERLNTETEPTKYDNTTKTTTT